jgi:hypothetical protein
MARSWHRGEARVRRDRLRCADLRGAGPRLHDRHRFERNDSARAVEPVRLVLEQLPATTGEMDALASVLPVREHRPDPLPPRLPELLDLTRQHAEEAVAALSFPRGLRPSLSRRGSERSALVTLASPSGLVPVPVPADAFQLDGPDGPYAAPVAEALDRYPTLGVALLAPPVTGYRRAREGPGSTARRGDRPGADHSDRGPRSRRRPGPCSGGLAATRRVTRPVATGRRCRPSSRRNEAAEAPGS